MSVVVNTNFTATLAANNLATANQALQKSLHRFSSGSKIVSPADDAGGLAVSTKLSATVRQQNAVKSNLGNVVSFLQMQDAGLDVTVKVLDRISELKVLFSDSTKNAADRANYDTEYQELKAELTSIGAEKFNGKELFGSSSMDVGLTEEGTSGLGLSVGGVDLLGSGSGSSGGVLLSDSFSGNSIDATKWTTSLPYGDSAVTQANGQLTSANRGYLTSVNSFTGPIEIDATITLTGWHTAANIIWKTDGTHSGGSSEPTNGLSLGLHDETQTMWVRQIGGPSASLNMPVPLGTPITIRIEDTGSSVSVYVNGSATPSLQLASYDPTVLGSNGKIDFYSRESAYTAGPVSAGLSAFSVTSGSGSSGGSNEIATVANTDSLANISLPTITDAIGDVATYRAQNGAQQRRLEFASELLTTNQTNLERAKSRITDVDVADESTTLARWSILVQAGTAMLSQANQSSQIALKLLVALSIFVVQRGREWSQALGFRTDV